jgi:hypothetical protein
MHASLKEERATPRVASAQGDNIIHEPETLIAYSDAYKVTRHVVGSVLPVQHMTQHITCDPEAAPYPELDQVKYRVIWISPAPSMKNHERLLDATMRDQDFKETMITGTGEGDENASLGEETDGIYPEEVKHKPQPTSTQY